MLKLHHVVYRNIAIPKLRNALHQRILDSSTFMYCMHSVLLLFKRYSLMRQRLHRLSFPKVYIAKITGMQNYVNRTHAVVIVPQVIPVPLCSSLRSCVMRNNITIAGKRVQKAQ